MNDKTPPGWYLGCDLDLDKYEALCNDWYFVQSYGDENEAHAEKKVVTALRLRVKGPAREVLDENKDIREKKKFFPYRADPRSSISQGTNPCVARTSRSSRRTTARTRRRSLRSTSRSFCSTRGSARRPYKSLSPSLTGCTRKPRRRGSTWAP